MGFVYEKVGKENEELWNSIGWKNWSGEPKHYIDATKWCIDKEREIYLLAIGSFRFETPIYFDMAYKYRIIRMDIRDYSKENGETSPQLVYRIDRMRIPKAVWEDRDDIIMSAKEAFTVHGFRNGRVKMVEVEMNCEPECVEVDYNGR